jgi:hypothetical protein
LLTGDVGQAREAFRQLLTIPIRFTPFIDKQGFHAIRFTSRLGLETVFAGLVTQLASPTGFEASGRSHFSESSRPEAGRLMSSFGA